MQTIELDRDQYLELEKIGLGAFAPLTGFMDQSEFNAVLNTMRLPNGEVFPIPVLLDIDEEQLKNLRNATSIDLMFDGEIVGRLLPRDFFTCDRRCAARKIFGTDDALHPGVRHFYNLKPVFVGGPVELLQRATFDISCDELTPMQTKQIFMERGWNRIVGFQTRNVPHRAHEYLQRVALEHADGLFIQPLVGRKFSGDFTPQAIMTGYRALIGGFFPKDRIVLGILSTVMRYAGPREAVFHAIIRRNYGCTHFIVGRDHAGVGNWYGLYDAHELTRRFDGELGIEIMRLHGPYFCMICDSIVTERTCPHHDTPSAHHISGTFMRSVLTERKQPDSRLMRPEIVSSLDGVELFISDQP